MSKTGSPIFNTNENSFGAVDELSYGRARKKGAQKKSFLKMPKRLLSKRTGLETEVWLVILIAE